MIFLYWNLESFEIRLWFLLYLSWSPTCFSSHWCTQRCNQYTMVTVKIYIWFCFAVSDKILNKPFHQYVVIDTFCLSICTLPSISTFQWVLEESWSNAQFVVSTEIFHSGSICIAVFILNYDFTIKATLFKSEIRFCIKVTCNYQLLTFYCFLACLSKQSVEIIFLAVTNIRFGWGIYIDYPDVESINC